MTVSTEKPSKRRGRPPIERPERKLANLSFRVRHGMREKLQISASARGLSISEEVERRLNLSFDVATNPHNEYVVRSAGEAISKVEEITQSSWIENSLTARLCHATVIAATSVMTAIHDKSNEEDEHAMIEAAGDVLGIQVALRFAGFTTESVVKFGRTDIDNGIDEIRRKILKRTLQQVDKAQERDPDAIAITLDADDGIGLGTAPPAVQDPDKLEIALQVMDRKRKTRRSGKP